MALSTAAGEAAPKTATFHPKSWKIVPDRSIAGVTYLSSFRVGVAAWGPGGTCSGVGVEIPAEDLPLNTPGLWKCSWKGPGSGTEGAAYLYGIDGKVVVMFVEFPEPAKKSDRLRKFATAKGNVHLGDKISALHKAYPGHKDHSNWIVRKAKNSAVVWWFSSHKGRITRVVMGCDFLDFQATCDPSTS